jgi:hypothetical protein
MQKTFEKAMELVSSGDAKGLSKLLKIAVRKQGSVKVLVEMTEYEDMLLMTAAEKGRDECVKALLKYSPEIQVIAETSDGVTALIMAAIKGHHG